MHEVLSEAGADDSGATAYGFIAVSVALVVVGIAFAYGVFAGVSQPVLGVILSVGFALLAVGMLLYFRIVSPHRIIMEADEELW